MTKDLLREGMDGYAQQKTEKRGLTEKKKRSSIASSPRQTVEAVEEKYIGCVDFTRSGGRSQEF